MKKFFTFVAATLMGLTASAQTWDFTVVPTQKIDGTGNLRTNAADGVMPDDQGASWTIIYNAGGTKDEEEFTAAAGEVFTPTKGLKWGILDNEKMVIWRNYPESYGGIYLFINKACDVTIPAKAGQTIEFIAGTAKNNKKISSPSIDETITVDGTVNYDYKSYTCTVTADNPVISFENNLAIQKIIVSGGQSSGSDAIYSWESPEGTVIETGGTATFEMGDEGENRVNYKNTAQGVDYYTLCLSGAKANIEDAEYLKNKSPRIKVTLDKALAGGETISVTAYTNKNDASKIATPYFKFENGTELLDDEKTYIDLGIEGNKAPATQTYTVPADAAGCTSFKMTRSQASTNLFITKLVITKGSTVGINNVETVRVADNTIYNLAGQKVGKDYKGIVIMNGKKYVK